MTTRRSLEAFYLASPADAPSVFHVWENGGAVGDSVTPSTYSPPYRLWMTELLRKLLDQDAHPALLSVGCGNAVVEASITAAGYRVLGVDAVGEAVELARAKGVDAVCADVLTWTPPAGRWTVIYADGLLGHLHDPVHRLQSVLGRFRSWLAPGGMLVVSNDGPRTADDIESHPTVPGFVWMSPGYLRRQLQAAQFQEVADTLFSYERPVSGARDRVIVTGAAPGEDER